MYCVCFFIGPRSVYELNVDLSIYIIKRMFLLFLSDGTVTTTNTVAETADVATELREA